MIPWRACSLKSHSLESPSPAKLKNNFDLGSSSFWIVKIICIQVRAFEPEPRLHPPLIQTRQMNKNSRNWHLNKFKIRKTIAENFLCCRCQCWNEKRQLTNQLIFFDNFSKCLLLKMSPGIQKTKASRIKWPLVSLFLLGNTMGNSNPAKQCSINSFK